MSRHTMPTTALNCLRRTAIPTPSTSRRFLSSSLASLASSPASSSTSSSRSDPPSKFVETLGSILNMSGVPPPPISDTKGSARYMFGEDTKSADEFDNDVENNRDNILHVGNLVPPRQAYTLPQAVAEVKSGLASTLAATPSVVGGLGIPPRKDPLVDLMTNLMMKHGKKAEAEKRMSDILGLIQRSTNSPPLPYLHRAIHLTSPHLRLRTLRRSSKNIPLPTPLDARQSARTGILWILKAAERGRAGGLTRRSGRIAREVMGIVEWGVSEGRQGGSDALKRKEEVHRLGAVNRSNLNMRG